MCLPVISKNDGYDFSDLELALWEHSMLKNKTNSSNWNHIEKRIMNKSNWIEKGTHNDPNETKRAPKGDPQRSKISFVILGLVRQSCKNGHDALVVFTIVKGTSVDHSSFF